MPKILVADDSITVRKVAERLLIEAGLEVALAASGEEALAWLVNERPDFIITDVIMPDKSGYDVCKFVKAHADLSDTPVLLISGIVNEDVTRKAESCRADGVLKKPFQGTSLQDRVLELLAKRGEKVSASLVQTSNGGVAAEPLSPSAGSFDPGPSPQLMEETVTQDAPESGVATAAVGFTAQKAFRITEEQLQGFRQSAGRIKELEALLQEERARADHLSEQMDAAKQTERRLHELEVAVADREQRWAEETHRVQTNGELENRNKELTALLSEQEQHVSELTDQLNRFEELEKRNKDLEAALENLQARLSMTEESSLVLKGNGDGMPQLHTLITDQQQRLSELASQVIRYGEAETKIKALEASLGNEQSRASEMVQRCAELERAAARAAMKLEDMTKLLSQISRLASIPEENQDSASS